MSTEGTPNGLKFKPDELVRSNSTGSLGSSCISDQEERKTLLPEVSFAPCTSNGRTAVDSPRNNSESQPLLGRMDPEVSYNRFPGIITLVLFAFYNFFVSFIRHVPYSLLGCRYLFLYL